MNKNHIYTYINNLIAMANCDGEISEREITFIKKRASELGLNPKIIDSLIEDAHNIDFVVPKQIINRIDYIDDLIEMTVADNIIHTNELQLCKLVCNKFNIPEEYLEEALLLKNIIIEQ